jgi:hypothetical protein
MSAAITLIILTTAVCVATFSPVKSNKYSQHWIIDANRIYLGFVSGEHAPGGSLLFLGNLADGRYLARSVLFALETTIMDGLMVSRHLATNTSGSSLPKGLPSLFDME